MAWYTVKVQMEKEYSIEADNKEEAERLVQVELPGQVTVGWVNAELEE